MIEPTVNLRLTANQAGWLRELASLDLNSSDYQVRKLAAELLEQLNAATTYQTSATVCEAHPDRTATWELFIDGEFAAVTLGQCDECAEDTHANPGPATLHEAQIPLVWCSDGHWVGTDSECSCAVTVPWAC